MSSRTLCFALLLLFCEEAGTGVPSPEEISEVAACFPHLKYLFLSACIMFIGIVEYLLKSYDYVFATAIFCIIVGFLFGVGSIHVTWMYQVAWASQTEIMLDGLLDVFVPILIYATAFSLDMHAFHRSLYQIMIVSFPVSMFGAVLTGIMTKLMQDYVWKIKDALLFGAILSGIYPVEVLEAVKESSVQTKYVMSLLHGETLLGTMASIFFFDVSMMYLSGWTVYWYQFAAIGLRISLGLPLGYLFGTVGAILMKLSYANTPLLILLTLSSCYTSFFVTRYVTTGGLFAVMLTGILMGMERPSLSQETQEIIVGIWKMFSTVSIGVVCVMMSVRAPWLLLFHIELKEYILVLVTYLICNLSRFLSYFVFSPLLSRTGYGMSFQNLILCVWCGLKNPICMCLVSSLEMHHFYKDEFKGKLFFLHVIGVYFLMLVVNGTFVPILLRALGLADISPARQANMNNCVKYINEARARTIAILKMDRFLSDANWPLVNTCTALKHPYKKTVVTEEKEDEDDDEDFFLGYKFTYCPDCQKHIPNEPTPKEMREMTKEAKLRILKLKKTAYSRQYENGMISREGVRILHQCVEIAMDTEAAVIELDGLLEMFTNENQLYKILALYLQTFTQSRDEHYRPPKKKYRQQCYRFINNPFCWIFMTILLLIQFTAMIIFLTVPVKSTTGDVSKATGAFVFFAIYFVEFIVKIQAYSTVSLIRNGLKTYFRFVGNIAEFLIMCWTLVKGIKKITWRYSPADLYLDIICIILIGFRILRLARRLKLFNFMHPFLASILKYLDYKLNRQKALAYELGKNYIAGEEEILENLNLIVDNLKIRRTMKEASELDRHVVSRRMGLSQKERPAVASTVKTKAATRTVLNGMKDDIYELKVSGWVDDLEYKKLLLSLAERYKCVNNLKFVPPSRPRLIFQTLPFMGDDDEVIEYLYSNVSTRKYDPGNVVVEEGETAPGVYILITGLLLVNYLPNETVLNVLKEQGTLPVVDHLCSNDYSEQAYEYFLPGNTIGQLSALTGRTYDGEVIAEAHSEVYFLSTSVIRSAMSMDPDPVNGLECRIWKDIAFGVAIEVMMGVPSYRSYSQERIKYLIERSFIPDLSNYKIFVSSEMMQDIILIEGVVIDFNTRDIYTAPTYVPRAVQKLVLPKSSLVNMQNAIETKLMILPAKDFDEYEIMFHEEQIAELVSSESNRCLHHLMKDTAILTTKGSREQKRALVIKQLRKKLVRTDSAKNKISFAGGGSINATLSI